MQLKQVTVVRQDLKLPKGKLSVQVSHASLEAAMKSDKKIVSEWRREGAKKVVLKTATKEDLFKYKQQAEDSGLITALITDAGKTTVAPGTITCLAIGPDEESKIDRITGKLKMV